MQMFYAFESKLFYFLYHYNIYDIPESDWCMRFCCGKQRSFVIHIVDSTNQVMKFNQLLKIKTFIFNYQEIMRINRGFKFFGGNQCCAGICNACAHEIKVTSPDGTVYGYVKQRFG